MKKIVALFLLLTAGIGLADPSRPTDPSTNATLSTLQATELP